MTAGACPRTRDVHQREVAGADGTGKRR
jgi:hypothetical protein